MGGKDLLEKKELVPIVEIQYPSVLNRAGI